MSVKKLTKHRIHLAIFWVLSFSSSPILSLQELSSVVDAPFFDVAIFNKASTDFHLSHFDLYIKVFYNELQFVKSDDKFKAQFEISISVFDTTGKFVNSDKIKQELVVASFEETKSVNEFSLRTVSFDLPPKAYEITVDLQDMETQKKGRHKRSVSLKDYSTKDILTSDILFLDFYSRDKQGKVTFEPRVSETKDEDSKLLYVYVELYNIPENDSLLVEYHVLGQDHQIFQSDKYWIRSRGRITQNIFEISTENLSHGGYIAKVKFSSGSMSITVESAFKLYIDGIPLTFADLEEAIEVLKYIASDEELKKLKNTPKDQKQNAFIKFWKKNDPTPETAENELRKEYYRRIQFANKKFHSLNRSGWKTDMGWVYILIGAPDSIDRNPFNQKFANSPGKTIKAIELWTYYEYNKQLLFLDELGFGNFRLENRNSLFDLIN